MAAVYLSFYAVNKESEIKPLAIKGGIIQEPAWRSFQAVVDIIVYTADKLQYMPVLNVEELPKMRQQQVIVLLVEPPRHFSDAALFKNLITDNGLRPLGSGNPREYEKGGMNSEAINYQPILAIGYEDIMNLLAEKDDEERNRKAYQRSYSLDPRFKFMDSSIWHRYVPVYPDDIGQEVKNKPIDIPHFKSALQKVLEYLFECHRKELYETNAAKAMLEFQLRMLRESYIIPFGEENHSKFVTPFKFHSETKMQLEAERLLREYFDANGLRSALKWRFLLVDDYADEGISRAGKDNIQTSKKTLIDELLSDFQINIDYPREKGNKKESAKTNIIKKSLKKLAGPNRYDVLLLDYLLAPIPGKDEREYGYEFLQRLLEDSERKTPKYKRGPFMRYWIFPISSFPFALYDKLRQLGIDNYHELWHLSGGGDPITTPQLFRYNLLNFLKHQVMEAYLADEALARYFSTYSGIKDRKTWSEIIEAHLGYLMAQIKSLESNQPNDEIENFSTSLYHYRPHATYQSTLGEFIDIIKLADEHRGNNESLLSFIEDSKMPEELPKPDWKRDYPQSINVLRKKIKEYFYSAKELENIIEQHKNSARFPPSHKRRKIMLSLPANIKIAKDIQFMKLSNHWLRSLPEELAALSKLHSLDLSDNKLEEFPEVLFKLKDQLKNLNLSGNSLPEGLNREVKKEQVLQLFEEAKRYRPKSIIEQLADIEKTPIKDLGLAIDQIDELVTTHMPHMKELRYEILSLMRSFHKNEKEHRANRRTDNDYDSKTSTFHHQLNKIIDDIREQVNSWL